MTKAIALAALICEFYPSKPLGFCASTVNLEFSVDDLLRTLRMEVLLSVEILRLLLLPCWFSYQTNEDKIRIFAALILLTSGRGNSFTYIHRE